MVEIKNNRMALNINEVGACIDQWVVGNICIATKGATVGRYANRIAKGKFTLNGKEYQLNNNDGENHLHGGPQGFMHKTWALKDLAQNRAMFEYISPDGDENYPGMLVAEVQYTLTEDALQIDYMAISTADTIINLTNHSYFNLNGGARASAHKVFIDADRYTEVDEQLIPTGKLPSVEGTKYDFRKEKVYTDDLDINFCLNGEGFREVARVKGMNSEIEMTILTDQPGMQVYNTDEEICFETQNYPDSPNHPDFPSAVLKAGTVFRSTTVYKLNIE